MEAIEGAMQIETPQGTDAPGSQPAYQPEPQLDEAAVRAAVMAAEAKGDNPLSLQVKDVTQGEPANQAAPKEPARTPALEVPEKFKKPTGEVDVEKLKASTRQLDEAIEKKETAISKTVDDYLREYQEKQAKFRNMPNPAKLQPTPPPIIPDNPAQLTDKQLEEMINRDLQQNPAAAVVNLLEIALQKRFEPLEEERKQNQLRSNIEKLAQSDPRVLNDRVFSAITAKLADEPELWRLKNPHKAAWLEVKEDMHLGDLVERPTQAQPSRGPSPILGGGTPPPAPSSSSNQVTYQSLNEAITSVLKQPGLRKDSNVMGKLDEAAKKYFDQAYR